MNRLMKAEKARVARKHDREKIFAWIVDYKRRHDGNSPSMREIMQAFGVTSLSLMDYILDDLVDAGKITREGTRGMRVTGGRWWYYEVRDEDTD
ncbi:MAG: hypothetical protein AB1453_12110 [Chloroflexota bacterium]